MTTAPLPDDLGVVRGSRPFWAPDHPVLQVLRTRRADGSRPGARTDSARVALAVEGGGMRGILSAAMLGALKSEGFLDCFDHVYAMSSGALNAAYALSSDTYEEHLSIYFDDLPCRTFLDWRRGLHAWNRDVSPLDGAGVLNVDFAFDEIFDRLKPLDYAAVLRSPIPLHVAITLVDSLRTAVPSSFTDAADLRSALRAGAWLPLATRGTATFRGERALDGGLLTSHPARLAVEDGCTHVLSLSTKLLTGRSGRPHALHRAVGRRLNRVHSGLGDGYLASLAVDAADRSTWHRMRTEPGRGAFVLDLGPVAGDAVPTLSETDRGRLFFAARLSYATMLWALSGAEVRVVPVFAKSTALPPLPVSPVVTDLAHQGQRGLVAEGDAVDVGA